jgi:hypothetical protein
MKNIAIVSIFGHMECLGYLLETFRDDNVTVIYTSTTDNYGWVEYFQTIYPNLKKQIMDVSTIQSTVGEESILNNYDKVFCLTFNEFPHKNVVSILHINEHLSRQNENNPQLLSLTPYVYGSNITYTFPVFAPLIKLSKHQNIVTSIGWYSNNQMDQDTSIFIQKNRNYTFYFVVSGDNKYTNFQNHPNVVLLQGISTQLLINLVENSKFILSKKYIHRDRFSGQLGLAMSFQKPLIIDELTAQHYNLPGITYKTYLNELESLDNISNETYHLIVDKIQAFNQHTIRKNQRILSTTNTIYTTKNTVLLVEPRKLDYIKEILQHCHKCLGNEKWDYVFYCGKGTIEYWKERLEDWIELRELNVDNFSTPTLYSDFMKSKELWECLNGKFILTIQPDTWILNKAPHNIDYFIALDKSFIGGNIQYIWWEFEREKLSFDFNNFNGGLSLRKREDMIRVIESFPPLPTEYPSKYMATDAEDVYFSIGCHKLGFTLGDDENSSHFAVHSIYKDSCFGFHFPSSQIEFQVIRNFPELAYHPYLFHRFKIE